MVTYAYSHIHDIFPAESQDNLRSSARTILRLECRGLRCFLIFVVSSIFNLRSTAHSCVDGDMIIHTKKEYKYIQPYHMRNEAMTQMNLLTGMRYE